MLEGIDFLSDDYLYPTRIADGVIEETYGNPVVGAGADAPLNDGSPLDLDRLYLHAYDTFLSLALVIAGDVFADRGSYLIYMDTSDDAMGANVDVGPRPITVADPYKPEFRLDVTIQEERGTVSGRYVLNRWVEDDWETVTFTGSAAILNGEPSVIEYQIPLALIGNPSTINMAVVSTARGRARGASDVLGAAFMRADSSETLDKLFRYDIYNK